jgi:hypothetical protein
MKPRILSGAKRKASGCNAVQTHTPTEAPTASRRHALARNAPRVEVFRLRTTTAIGRLAADALHAYDEVLALGQTADCLYTGGIYTRHG